MGRASMSPRRVIIAGGHGKIALQLGRALVEDGTPVSGLIRNTGHSPDLLAIGIRPVTWDLEQDGPGLAEVIAGASAVVFAAGAGPGSGAGRKQTMDRDGAIRLMEAAREANVHRYVMVSAMGARGEIDPGGGVFEAYLRAKAEADRVLQASGLDWTIVRPGTLTDDAPRGRIALGPELPPGSIPRSDVAVVLAAVLAGAHTIHKAFDVVSGSTRIVDAVASA